MSNGSFAQAGFYYQNNLAALKLLELFALDSNVLEIHLENYSKGNHIDDIIITRKKLVQYYQVKWAEDVSISYTIHNLLTAPEAGEESLWKKLVEGYLSITDKTKNIEIILYSPRQPGTSKQPTKGIDKSLTQLIKFHKDYVLSDNTSIKNAIDYPEFSQVFRALIAASGLDESQFDLFFKCLKFELNAPELDDIKLQLEHKHNKLGLEINQVAALLDSVVKWSISGESINKTELLSALGITNRFTDRLSHVFKVDESLYIENLKLFDNLDNSLASLDSGYIFVQGVPGSGKSTALTKYLNKNKDIQFAYYCFIPGDVTTTDHRLKAPYFLQSLCVAIEKNFPTIDLPLRYSDQYEEKFSQYLSALSQLNKRIVFLIDGLDHVHRNMDHLHDPLTNNIAGELPLNIFIIISSQYIESLPASIRVKIGVEPLRSLKMDKFSMEQTKEYADKKHLHLNSTTLSQLYATSEGIPLYLYYICSSLSEADPRNYNGIIATFPVLVNSEINTYHAWLFEQIRNDTTAIWVLGLLAYRKEYSTIQVLETILTIADISADVVSVKKIIRQFNHLLKEKDGISYVFYHNSFREFVIRQTLELEEPINNALIKYYQDDSFSEEAFRNYFVHLYSLKRYQEIIDTVNDAWITVAWNRCRTLSEIDENINIAWKSCVELTSINDFVRIAFLKYQVGLSKFNLENGDFDDSYYFLAGNLIKESLRTIWDGEIPLSDDVSFFNSYCVQYFERTDTLISSDIANQFFRKFLIQIDDNTNPGNREPDLESYIKARILYESASTVLEDMITYQEYLSVENLKKIVAFAVSRGKLLHIKIFWEQSAEEEFRQYVLSQFLIGLYDKKSEEVNRYLPSFSFDTLMIEDKINYVSETIAHVPGPDLLSAYGNMDIDPFLDPEIISDDHRYPLKSEVLSLYGTLRVYYLLKPENYSLYEIRLSTLPHFVRCIYRAISSAAKVWSDKVQEKGPLPQLRERLIGIIDSLNIPAHIVLRVISGHGKPSFIKYEMWKIYGIVFRMFDEVCSDDDLKYIIPYYIEKHADANGIHNFQNNLEFADAIKSRSGLKVEMLLLLKQAEQLARDNEGTTTLVSNLTAVGRRYGLLSFSDHYNRIYQELLSLGCGVSYRKDYQFANIFEVLEEVHKSDPASTLPRLADIYYLLFKIKDAGDSRMFHICLSILMKFAFQHYPGLGFDLLIKNEEYVGRDESLKIILKDIIPTANDVEIPYLWAIIKTMGKWENLGKTGDNEIQIVYEVFFKRLANYKEQGFVKKAYDYVCRQYTTEQNMPQKIYIINEILSQSTTSHSFLQTPVITPSAPPVSNASQIKTNNEEKPLSDSFKRRVHKLSKEQINKLTFEGPEEVNMYIAKYVGDIRYNNMLTVWRKLYNNAISSLNDWFKGLADGLKDTVILQEWSAKKLFLLLRDAIYGEAELTIPFIKDKLDEYILQCDVLLPGVDFAGAVGNKLDVGQIAERIINDLILTHSKILGAITDEEIVWLTAHCDHDNIRHWEGIIMQYFSKEILVAALGRLSKNAFVYDESFSRELLIKALAELDKLSYRSGDPDTELLEWCYECMPAEANKYLLQSFYTAHANHYYEILYDIDSKLLPFIEHFNEPTFFQTYFTSNFEFNVKLGAGLAEPAIDNAFIKNYRNEEDFLTVACDYLVSLFDYPVVKIRQLAIQSLYDLILDDEAALSLLIRNKFKGISVNQVEHLNVLLYSITLHSPESVVSAVNELEWLLDRDHFNIQQTFAELIIYLSNKGMAINQAMKERVRRINLTPAAPNPVIFRSLQSGYGFIYSDYQVDLTNQIEGINNSDKDFVDELFTTLLDGGYDRVKSHKAEIEMVRKYNMNSTDPIEINSNTFQTIQDKVNKLFLKNIGEGSFEDTDIIGLKYNFRLYDPTDQITHRVQKPRYVYWKGKEIAETAFMEFQDADELFLTFLNREADAMTLYEKGRQQMDLYPAHYASYFEVTGFLVEQNPEVEELHKILTEHTPYFHHDNLFRFEMMKFFENSGKPIAKKINPLIAASAKNFRGKEEDAIAILLPHIINEMGLNQGDGYLNFNDSLSNRVIEFIEWQEPFKEHYRKRLEPSGQGVVLNIKKEVLLKYLADKKKTLYYYFTLKRSTDKYKPESEMQWETKSFLKPYQTTP